MLVLPAIAAALTERPALHVLTWADYIDPTVVADFEHRHGVRVVFGYMESDDRRDQLLAGNDGRGYDVIMVNEINLLPYARRRWIAPIDSGRLLNFRHLDPRWLPPPVDKQLYGIPYFWGTLGIAYRKDLVPQGFPSWNDFFIPRPALTGKINLIKSSRELFASALKALGFSVNDHDPLALAQAEQLLLAQRPAVKSYDYVALTADSALVSGQVWASLMYSGDALMLAEYQPDIAYTVPREGCLLWIDYFAIAQSSTQKELALAFIDFLNNPQTAARNAQYVHYAPPNTGAKAYLPRDYFDNPVIYPPAEVTARCEYLQQLPARAQKRLNKLALRLFDE